MYLSSTVSNALRAAEDALISGDEDKLYEALKAMGVQNLQPQNKGWYLKQLQAERENKEQVGSKKCEECHRSHFQGSHHNFSMLGISWRSSDKG